MPSLVLGVKEFAFPIYLEKLVNEVKSKHLEAKYLEQPQVETLGWKYGVNMFECF